MLPIVLAQGHADCYIHGMTEPPERQRERDSPLHHFLHALGELERTVEHDLIQWNAELALAAQRRLDKIVAILRRITAGLRSH